MIVFRDVAQVQFFVDKYRVGAVKDFPWFSGPHNLATFVTHPINTRRHAVVEAQYGDSFLNRGVVPFVSGSPLMVWAEI